MNWLFTRLYLAVWIALALTLATSHSSWGQAISVTSNISPSTNLCTNSTVSLPFSTTGTFSGGNIFSLQRSNESGSFASPVEVGTLNASPNAPASLTLTGNLGTAPYGTGYRFRVVSSKPVVTSSPTPAAVTIGTNVPTVNSNYTFCQNSGTQPITASGTGTIEWFSSSAANAPVVATGNTYNVSTDNSATYYVSQTVNGCKSAKVAVSVTVSSPTGAPTVTTPPAYCPGQGPAVLTATPTGTGVASGIQWVSSGGKQTGATIPAPQTTGTYTYTVSQSDSRGCTSPSTTVATITVNAAPTTAPVPNVPAPYCADSPPGPLSAALNGGATSLKWYNLTNGTTATTQTIPAPTVTTQYQVSQLIGNCEGPKSAVFTVTVSTRPADPTLTSSGPFCQNSGTNATQTITASGQNVEWFSSATSATAIATGNNFPISTAGGNVPVYFRQVTNGCASNRVTATVTINPTPSAAPQFTAPAPYCADAVPGPLTATLSGGATSLKWYNLTTGVSFTTQTIPAPSTTTDYQVSQLTGNCEGPRSVVSTVTVNPKPVNPTLNSAGPFCQNSGSNATQTITATGTGTIEWFTSASSTSAIATGTTFSISTAGGNVPVYFRQVVNGCASDRVTATVTVNPTPSTAPQFTPPATYCSNATPGTLSVSLTNGATSARWYTVGGGSTDGVSIPAPTVTTQYQVSQFIGGCEGPRSAAFTVNVTPKPANPSAGITGPFCQNSGANNVQTVTATGNGTIEWFVNASTPNVATTGTSYTVSTAVASPQTVYYRQVVNGCPSDRLAMTVPINPIPAAPAVTSTREYCAEDVATPLTATGNGLLWYTTVTGGTGTGQAPTPSTSAANVGTAQLFYVSQTVNNCESPRQSITVTVKRKPAPPVTTGSLSFCQNTAPVSLSAQGESGATLIWITKNVESPAAPAIPSTVADTYTYQVIQLLNGCRSEPASVAVTVKPTPGTPTITPYTLCQGRESRGAEVAGTELKFYSASDQFLGTTAPVPSTTQPTTFTYKVSQTTNSCEGPKATYTVPVNTVPGTPAFTQPKDYCAEEPATPLVATGTALLWYTVSTGGSPANQAPTPSTSANNVGSGQTFYVTQTVNGCESNRQPISVTVKRKPAPPTTTNNIEFCQNSPAPTLTATTENGASLIWIGTDNRESATAPTPPNNAVNTYTYQVLQNLNGCRSNQTTIQVRVKQTPGQPGIIPFELCQSAPGRALQASGNDLKYYDANSVLLGSTAPVVNTDQPRTVTYKVSQSIENCEGPKIDYAILVKPKPAPPVTQSISYCVENSGNPDQPKQAVQPLTAQGQSLLWFASDGNAYPAGFAPTPGIDRAYTADYRVTQTVNNCVSDQALLRVTVQATPAPTVASALVTYCRNEAARPLEATGTNLRWIDPNGIMTTQTPTPPTGNATKGGEAYQVYSIGANGCVSPRSTIKLVINTNPTLGLLGSTTVNYGLSASLTLRFTSSPPFAYTLSDGTSGVATDTVSKVSVKPLQTTIYQVASVSNVCGNGLPGNPATATVFVNVPVITTQAITAGTVCAGTSLPVTYTTTGVFNPGNAFKVQVADTLSKKYIDVSPTGLGSTLTATLPLALKEGVYFVRVLATNPGAEVGGLPSPKLLTVLGLPSAVLTGTQDVYEGSPASLTVALTGSASWTVSYSFLTEGGQPATSTFQTSTNPHILSVQPPKTASYFLTAVSNTCGTGPVSGTALVTVLPLLAVENPLLTTVSLYPVPTQNQLTVVIDLPLTAREPAQLILRDLTGLPVLNRQTDARHTVLDLRDQPAGIYLLNVQVGEHRTVRRVLKL